MSVVWMVMGKVIVPSSQSDDFNMLLYLFHTIYQVIKCTTREEKDFASAVYTC